MNQYLVDYTVRNITTGDEEEIRVLELTDDEYAGFPDEVREEIRNTLHLLAWGTPQYLPKMKDDALELIRQLLLPFISDRELYDESYVTWEQNLIDQSDGEGAYAPAPNHGFLTLWLTARQWYTLTTVVDWAAAEAADAVGNPSGWGPFESATSIDDASDALEALSEALATFQDNHA